MVVERGLARCPRCVSVADYVFIETAPGRESGRLRYEVHCRKCGESYGEDSLPPLPQPIVVAEPPIVWPPDREPVEPRDWRHEVHAKLGEVRDMLSAAGKRSAPVVDGMVRRTRTYAPKRWMGRKDEDVSVDQTGG